MNLASWNVRGLNKASHQREVKNFISSNSLSFLCCLETKVKREKSTKISQKINNRWSWAFNYDCHPNGGFGSVGTRPFGKLEFCRLRTNK